MLDTSFHQGASLHFQTPQDELRLLAVASPQPEELGLETLWQVCLHLQRLGYPVVVLDGTAQESDDAPGLLDLLVHAPWHDGGLPGASKDTSNLAVLPAAQGLSTLACSRPHGQQALQALHPIFRRYAVVVVHAPLATLASPLLTGTTTTPLLITQPGKSGVLNSYRQLKHLALHAGLAGTVACVAQRHQRQQAGNDLRTLQQCAARHLGQQIRTTTIDPGNPQDLQRLALQLLENAGTINPPAAVSALPSLGTASIPTHFVQSH